MITAKLIKIQERFKSGSSRLRDKDAVDTLRVLVATETNLLVAGFRLHESEPGAAAVTHAALEFLSEQHAGRGRSALG